MPRGDKSSYTDKQKRQAEHIEDSYEAKGLSKETAEKRAWAVAAKEYALERKAIDVHVTGADLARLLPLIGPLSATRLWASPAQEGRARKILRGLAGTEARSHPGGAVRVERGHGPSMAATAVLGIAALGAGFWPQVERAFQEVKDEVAAPAPVAPVRFELRYVEDEHELITREMEFTLEEMARVRLEDAPLGPGWVEARRYVVIEPLADEPVAQTRDRVLAILSKNVPAGKKIAWGPVYEQNPDTGDDKRVGVRSFLLGDVVLTERDIIDAAAKPDPMGGAQVSITFTREGGDRFAEATRNAVKRRIAIVVDDEVLSAPFVQGEITGGSAVITMGKGDPEAKLREAEELARKLRGGRDPGR